MVQLCCATYLDQVLSQPWAKFWLNLFDFWVFFFPFFSLKICWNHYVYSVFSNNLHFLSPPPKIRNTICEHNCANFFYFGPFFSAFLLFWVFVVSVFWSFVWEEWKKTKFKTQQQQRNENHKMKQQNHLVCFQKRTRQHRHKIIQINCLKWKQTTQEKQTRTKTWNWQKNYLVTNMTENTRIAGKIVFFHCLWKQNKNQRKQSKQKKNKWKTYQKQSPPPQKKTERQKHETKTETKSSEERKKQPKMKATWASIMGS